MRAFFFFYFLLEVSTWYISMENEMVVGFMQLYVSFVIYQVNIFGTDKVEG